MKWDNIYNEKWVKHFAFLPKRINGATVWLEFYQERFKKKYKKCECGKPILVLCERKVIG